VGFSIEVLFTNRFVMLSFVFDCKEFVRECSTWPDLLVLSYEHISQKHFRV